MRSGTLATTAGWLTGWQALIKSLPHNFSNQKEKKKL